MCIKLIRNNQRGTSLIEVIIFIIVVSVGVAGLMSVLSSSMKHSADPMLRKQALAVAEALLEEVSSMPFTACDPDHYDVATDVCTLAEGMGPEAGEVRGSLTTPFDNVNDYNNFCLGGGFPVGWVCSSNAIGDIGGSASVVVPTGYVARVDVVVEALGTPAVANALRISVTVSYNNNSDTLTLEGYRTRYAPNDMP